MLENEIKSKVHGVDSLEVSAIDEVRYQSRFIKFMDQNLWSLIYMCLWAWYGPLGK